METGLMVLMVNSLTDLQYGKCKIKCDFYLAIETLMKVVKYKKSKIHAESK